MKNPITICLFHSKEGEKEGFRLLRIVIIQIITRQQKPRMNTNEIN